MQREWTGGPPPKEIWEELKSKAIESLQELEYNQDNFNHFFTFTVKAVDPVTNTCDGTATSMASDTALFNMIIQILKKTDLEQDVLEFILRGLAKKARQGVMLNDVKGNA